MSIEAILRRNARALARSMTPAEWQQLRTEILTADDTPESSADGPADSLTAVGPALGRGLSADKEAAALAAGDRRVLERYLQEGKNGHAASARRAAELLELTGDDESAGRWWRTAARLGDRDAIDYVDAYVTGLDNTEALTPQRRKGGD